MPVTNFSKRWILMRSFMLWADRNEKTKSRVNMLLWLDENNMLNGDKVNEYLEKVPKGVYEDHE